MNAISGFQPEPGPQTNCEIAEPLLPFLFQRARYKVAYGGRAGAKSWSIARALVLKVFSEPGHLILCAREFQSSMADSVHMLLQVQIRALGLEPYFIIQDQEIICRINGSRFIFKGLRRHINEIKSLEGVTICWVEEAQAVSEHSWKVLTPTIRKPGSEIWISFNPQDEDDPTYTRFVLRPPPGTISIKINWNDNPWFYDSPGLNAERLHMLATDPDAYDWVWEGNCRHVSEATIFRGLFEIAECDMPEHERPFFGLDFGFATDPTACLRFWVEDHGGPGKDILNIDHEAFGYGVEIDDHKALIAGGRSNKNPEMVYPGIPGATDWPIMADSSRPETISFLRGQGLNVRPAKKWEGCVEDGVAYLKSYKKIRIHPRCKHMLQEARLYSYKVDKRTGDVLPVIEDKHNHGWDAIRYGHGRLITRSGGVGTWKKLAAQMKGG